jgi:CRISPR-associated endonuclease/helicase Cas3
VDYIAHVKRLENDEWDEPQLLSEHLQKTAELAAKFAEDFDSSEWAYALGMMHDAGKGAPEWQNYLRSKSGYDEEASSEAILGKVKHSGAGAKLAEELFGVLPGRFLSYAIAGHHTGLPDFGGSQSSLAFQLQHTDTEKIASEFKNAAPSMRSVKPPWRFALKGLDLSLWIRMLFSCLIDADRLNTEEYMNPDKSAIRNKYLPITELISKFDIYMDAKTKKESVCSSDRVYQARQQVLSDCLAAADMQPGFFSLTVPTGGGKTLSSMAFALRHANKFGKKRIIYVIPYTSIIEQNAKVFRDIFGPDEIVEHHANLDDEDSSVKSRLATENWDAPIIVTTNVQFFESLFASKTSRCRKLHNIANSVVILDEAQLVPSEFLEPILATMQLLVERYKVTFVICTATQPAFERRDDFPEFPGLQKGSIREIIQDAPSLYKNLERVKVEIRDDSTNDWNDLAAELALYDQVLCIVSDRKSCRELHAAMPAGTYHLSALMCAEHRSRIIAEIKEKLAKRETIRVISTQLIEAGVDIDFTTVYRAKAGLDSIAQAAGRCNREGKLNEEGKLGKVVIFNGVRKAPAGILRKASESAESVMTGKTDPIDQSLFAAYFANLYWKINSLDKNDIMKLLKPDDKCEIQFRSAAEAFKIIDDAKHKTILVRYGEGGELIDSLKRAKVSDKGFEIKTLRKLQRYAITIYNNQFAALEVQGSLEEVIPGVFALNNDVKYDKNVGLLIDEASNDPSDYMVGS